MVKRIFFLFVAAMLFYQVVDAQVRISEYLSSNTSGLTDEDNEYSDWIELYNASDQPVNMLGYKLSDSRADTLGWVFPDVTIPARSFLVVFASGKDKNGISQKYHTIIRQGASWKYKTPAEITDVDWRNTNFDDSSWSSGASGFGYGDNDDATLLPNINLILLRKDFDIDNVAAITKMMLHVDYDDGFIAFINGAEVAMGGIVEFNDDYSVVSAGGHEAVMFSGGVPEKYDISDFISLLRNGKNTIAIQGHNTGTASTDFSLLPFLTIGSSQYTFNDVESFISVDNSNLHANFKISKEGEVVYLINPGREIIDSTKAMALDNDISYGRFPENDDKWYYFTTPTPGDNNINPLDTISYDSVLFSHEAGLYAQPFELSMTVSTLSAGEIRYTTDGSFPNAGSNLYTSPVPVSSTMVIRAAWFSSTAANNPITTKTFIFDSTNGLPTVSFSTDPANLFDWETGIFEDGPNAEPNDPHFGANYWQDWEKPINFEFFDKDGFQYINQGAGIKVAGNWSRARPQKSIALYARKNYGKGSFKYKFFNDRNNNSFESILLRNSGNEWGSTMFRDGLVSEIARDMDMERLAYQPVRVYYNGQYWGIHNLREKPSEHYFVENFGADEQNLNVLENYGTVVHGSPTEYNRLRSIISSKMLSDDANYRQVCEMMDIHCFIDYQLLEIFIGNGDWPGNNIKYWKTNDPVSKWRWLLFDTDFGLGWSSIAGNPLEFATATNNPSWPNPPWSTLFLRKLLTNQEFKNSFINRFLDCMNSNLMSDVLISKVDSIQNLLTPEMEHHINRWNAFSYNTWVGAVNVIKTYVTSRKRNMRTYLRNYFGFKVTNVITLDVSDNRAGSIKINSIVPSAYPFLGDYFGEVPVTLKAVPNPGYRFVRWSDGSSSTDLSITVNLTANARYTAVFEPSAEPDNSIVINEINYKSPDAFDAGDWIEIYNSGEQTADLTDWVLSDANTENKFVFIPGTLLYPGEYLVIVEDSSKFANLFPFVRNYTGQIAFGLSSSGDELYLFDNNGTLIDNVGYGVSAPWPAEACGLGPTLELKKPELRNELAANWSASRAGGTPGKQNSVFVANQSISAVSSSASCFPTIFSDYTSLQFFATKGGEYSVQIIDLQGRIYDKTSGYCNSDEMIHIDLFTKTERFPSGVYLVKVNTKESVNTVKVIKR